MAEALEDKSARIPRYNPSQRVQVDLRRLAVDPPRGTIDVAANGRVTLIDSAVDKFAAEYVHIQNVGTNKLKYALNSDASTGNYHEILAPGTANEDGLGASVEFNNFQIEKLTVFAEAGAASKVAVVIGRNPSRPNKIPSAAI